MIGRQQPLLQQKTQLSQRGRATVCRRNLEI